MTGLLLCSEPTAPTASCPEPFFCRASGWIDEKNFGGSHPDDVPSGIRLRWNLPFLSAVPAERPHGFPLTFTIYRSAPMTGDQLFEPEPTAGHMPITVAPGKLWANMLHHPPGSHYVVSEKDPCAEACAVYLELKAGAKPVEITLIDVDGDTLAVGYLKENDRFYFEVSRLASVTFSDEPDLQGAIRCLRPTVAAELEMKPIATVDARAWLNEPLGKISDRIARSDGRRLLTIDEPTWSALQQTGAQVADAHNLGTALGDEILGLATLAAHKWEAAALMGWAFIDGEHPPGPGYDQIVEKAMLQKPNGAVFGYQVVANFNRGVTESSTIYFVRAAPLPMLKSPKITLAKHPVVTFQSVNFVDVQTGAETPIEYPTPGAVGKREGPHEEQCSCVVTYELTNSDATVERINTNPQASDSLLTGKEFVGLPEFISGMENSEPPRIFGLTQRERRTFNYEVPFVDSKVWLSISAGDFWDRSLACPDTDPEVPTLKYAGRCTALKAARCNSPSRTAHLSLDEPWKADIFAQLLKGEIELLGQRPNATRLEVSTRVAPSSPHSKGGWVAILEEKLETVERDRLIGGTLETSSLAFQILGFEDDSGQLAVRFEVPADCGAIVGLPIQETLTDVVLRQANESTELWRVLDTIQIDGFGEPVATSREVDLNSLGDLSVILPHSMTLYFATRLAVPYAGKVLYGPITSPAAAPYIHDLPETPDLCVNVRQLGKDYYGRSFIRLEADGCDEFDERYLLRITCARGTITDQEQMQKIETSGIFQPQQPFQNKVGFEAFEMLALSDDGERFTAGISFVRDADDMEGLRDFVHFRAKAEGG